MEVAPAARSEQGGRLRREEAEEGGGGKGRHRVGRGGGREGAAPAKEGAAGGKRLAADLGRRKDRGMLGFGCLPILCTSVPIGTVESKMDGRDVLCYLGHHGLLFFPSQHNVFLFLFHFIAPL
jgi:hypothetical protein